MNLQDLNPTPLIVLPLQGLLSPDSLKLLRQLGALNPVEALSVMAAVVEDSIDSTDAGSCNMLAQVRVVEEVGAHLLGA